MRHITESIMEFREIIQDYAASDEEIKDFAHELWQILWEPLGLDAAETVYVVLEAST